MTRTMVMAMLLLTLSGTTTAAPAPFARRDREEASVKQLTLHLREAFAQRGCTFVGLERVDADQWHAQFRLGPRYSARSGELALDGTTYAIGVRGEGRLAALRAALERVRSNSFPLTLGVISGKIKVTE